MVLHAFLDDAKLVGKCITSLCFADVDVDVYRWKKEA